MQECAFRFSSDLLRLPPKFKNVRIEKRPASYRDYNPKPRNSSKKTKKLPPGPDPKFLRNCSKNTKNTQTTLFQFFFGKERQRRTHIPSKSLDYILNSWKIFLCNQCIALHALYIFLFPENFSYVKVCCPGILNMYPCNLNNPVDFKTHFVTPQILSCGQCAAA